MAALCFEPLATMLLFFLYLAPAAPFPVLFRSSATCSIIITNKICRQATGLQRSFSNCMNKKKHPQQNCQFPARSGAIAEVRVAVKLHQIPRWLEKGRKERLSATVRPSLSAIKLCPTDCIWHSAKRFRCNEKAKLSRV